jgi:hypothetical protein
MLGLLWTSYYEVYIVFFHAAVHLTVFLSLLVSADRILNIAKYLYIKLRQKVTGKAPEDYWNFQILPEDLDKYPKVRGPGCRRRGRHRRGGPSILAARQARPGNPASCYVELLVALLSAGGRAGGSRVCGRALLFAWVSN